MHVLVPIDGSDCSFRALEFALEFADRYDGSLHVVHFTDHPDESATSVLDRANDVLDAEGVDAETELLTDLDLSEPRYANQVGKDILEAVEERGYDHVVMGHHGNNTVGRIILGSAAETVLRASEIPVTFVP